MLNTARTISLIVLISLPMCLGFAADDGWGKWQDDDGSNVYEFLENNQFRFSGLQKVCIEYQGFAPNPLANLPRARARQGQYVQERKEFTGAWEAGERICTVIVPEPGKPDGNLVVYGNFVIYAEKIQCCMEAKRLGPTLVLRALNVDEPAAREKSGPEICVNRALRQSNNEPK